MILKEPGNVKIHRLRVIHLYEADYNLILSLKWRALQRHADRHHLLNDGQYGSRAGRESTALTLFEELRTDISLCSRKPLLNFDNDADSCYDRIVVAMSSLLSRKYGMHRHVVCVNSTTLQQARYKLKTSLGTSQESYSHCDEFPIFGTGQGSGNSPMIWCFVSSTLFDCHRSQAYGATFETPDRSITLTFSMVGFVDDSTGTVNDFHSSTLPTVESLVSKMQADAQLWSDLLWCSGGKLELPKCSYHFLYFDFLADGTPVPRAGSVGPQISVTTPDGEAIPIPAKSAYNPHKTLGHYKSPAGLATTQLAKLTTKQTKISQYLSSSPASRTEAYTYYHSIYIPLIHVLPQSFFSPKALDKAESKSMPSIFAKCGYNRNSRREFLYGPSHFLGGGFIRWRWLRGEGQIKQFLKYWRTDDWVSKALRIAVAWFQYHAGVGYSLLQHPSRSAPTPAGRWLPSLRQFLASISASLELDNSYIPPLQRLGDRLIIDVAIESAIFSMSELDIINNCRLYLNIATLADLTDATGHQLAPGIRWGDRAQLPFTPTGHTPHQASPSLLYWIYWQRLLNILFDPNDRLHLPLGAWLHPGEFLRNTWDAYFDFRYKFLYRRTDAGIPTTFSDYLAQLPMHEQALFADLHLNSSIFDIAQKLTPIKPAGDTATPPPLSPEPSDPPGSEFLIVSDGSQNSDTMTFGWTLRLPTGERLLYCSGPAFGRGSSHRAEATGMLSGVRFLHHLTHYTGLKVEAPYILKTDNQGLIICTTQRLAYDKCYPNTTLAADWDIIEAIHTTLLTFPSSPTISHVKGHQDRTAAYHSLPLDAQLNIDADAEATNYYLTKTSGPQLKVPLRPTTRAQLHIKEVTITGHYSTAIRTAAAEPEYFHALRAKYHWTPATFQTLDLESLSLASDNSTLPRPFLYKLVHKCLPTQAQKSKWDNGPSHCHYCRAPDDQIHFLRCSNPPLASWRTNFLQRFRARCDSLHTSFELQSVFVDALHALFTGRTIKPEAYPQHLRSVVTAQTRLGWQSFFRGYWTQDWKAVQTAYLKRAGITDQKYSAAVWASTLIRFCWQATHTAWNLHNTAIHSGGTTHRDKDLRDRTILRVRTLHQKRQDVLHLHQDVYFYPNLEDTIASASTLALRNWVQLYESAIHASIRLRSTIAVQQIPQLSRFFPILRPLKRPPKPRYSTRFHTRYDAPSKRKRHRKIPGTSR